MAETKTGKTHFPPGSITAIHRHYCDECGDRASWAVYHKASDVPAWFCVNCLPLTASIEACPCGCSIPMGSESYAGCHGEPDTPLLNARDAPSNEGGRDG